MRESDARGNPYVIRLSPDRNQPHDGRRLLRRQIAQGEPGQEDRLNETFVQDLAFRFPDLLPIDTIPDASLRFAPPLPLAREVATNAGPIDVLYVSPQGYLTILETKLWNNPEARREVVAQVIHYASALRSMSPAELLEACLGAKDVDPTLRASYEQDPQRALYRYVSEREPPRVDERDFYDTLATSLGEGELLLLVAGDGIRADVQGIQEYIQQPGLLFTLALVELKVFELDAENSLLVLPQVVGRTREEVIRTVVKVRDENDRPVVAKTNGVQATTPGRVSRITLSAETFDKLLRAESGERAEVIEATLERMRMLAAELDLQMDYRQSSVVAHLADPAGSDNEISLFVVDTDGTVRTGWMGHQLERIGLDVALRDRYFNALKTSYKAKLNKHGEPYGISLGQLHERPEPFETAVREFVEEVRATKV